MLTVSCVPLQLHLKWLIQLAAQHSAHISKKSALIFASIQMVTKLTSLFIVQIEKKRTHLLLILQHSAVACFQWNREQNYHLKVSYSCKIHVDSR